MGLFNKTIKVNKEKPCQFPECEKCKEFIDDHCNVAMVIPKQEYLLVRSILTDFNKKLNSIEQALYDHILGD